MSTPPAKEAKRRRRIWSEFVPYSSLASARVLALLERHDVQLLVAVTPESLDELPGLIRSCGDAGLQLGLWPMLADADGRWGSTFNAQAYADFVRSVVDSAPQVGTIAIDLEPPIAMVQGLLKGHPLAYRQLVRAGQWAPGLEILSELLAHLSDRGVATIAAVNPMLLADGRGESAWQWLFGTPIDALPFEAISFMAYTSLFEGYSRGLITRRVASALLGQTAQAAARQWGQRASLSLGTVGGGALGDERPFRSVGELAEDVALAQACGVQDLALFDLSGVLEQADPEVWIDAFATTPPATHVPPAALRARLLRVSLKRGGSVLAWYRRARERASDVQP